MSLAVKLAKIRLDFHATACDWNNVLNQLHIISDEAAEERNKKHVMIIVNDVLPRLGCDVEKFFKEEE